MGALVHPSSVVYGAGPLWPGLQEKSEGCLVQDLTVLSYDSPMTRGREFYDKESHSDNSIMITTDTHSVLDCTLFFLTAL